MSIALRVLVAIALLIAQQTARDTSGQPRRGTSVLSGMVVTNDADSRPIPRARITIQSDVPADGQVTTSDDSGRFVIRELPEGRFTLQAIKPPFVSSYYGATRPDGPGTPVAVADGQTISNLVIRMVRGAAIEGRVVDQNGAPMQGVSVVPLQGSYSPLTGKKAWVGQPAAMTDDRGIFRAFGLGPGEYLIVARPPILAPSWVSQLSGAPETRRLSAADVDRVLQGAAPAAGAFVPGTPMYWAPVYFPGTTDFLAATHITIRAGEEQSGINMQMRLERTSRITGIVTTPPGLSAPTVQITIVPADPEARIPGAQAFATPTTRPATDGTYGLTGVTPGSYLVNARAGVQTGRGSAQAPPPSAVFWASARVTVQGGDVEVPLAMQPGVLVSGRVELRTATPAKPDDLTGTRLMLRAADSGTDAVYQVPAQVGDAGTFTFGAMVPGPFRISHTRASGRELFMTSVTLAGREVLDDAINITGPMDEMTVVFTDQPSEITGALQDATGRAATDYVIVIFPTNRTYWTPISRRVMQTRPGSDGKYRLRNLPAGEYFIAALTDLAPGQLSDTAFLAQISAAAIRVTVVDGKTTSQSFRIGGKF